MKFSDFRWAVLLLRALDGPEVPTTSPERLAMLPRIAPEAPLWVRRWVVDVFAKGA